MYVWMVLDCHMWCNIVFPYDILIEFVQNKFKSIFRYVGQTKYLPTYLPIEAKNLSKDDLLSYLGKIPILVSR